MARARRPRSGDPHLSILARLSPDKLSELTGMSLPDAARTQAALLFHRLGVGEAQVARAVQRTLQALDAEVVSRKVVDGEVLAFNDVDHRTRLMAAELVTGWGREIGVLPEEAQKAVVGGGAIHLTVVRADGSQIAIGGLSEKVSSQAARTGADEDEPPGVGPGARGAGGEATS